MNNSLSTTIGTVLSGLLMIAILLLVGYVYGSRSAQVELAQLKGQIIQQTEQAEAELLSLTKERDKKQAERNAQALLQEGKDNAAKDEIIRLTGELANRPIGVRIVTKSGQSNCGTSSNGAATSKDSPGNATETTGLLPESNSKRLRSALTEVETLSAAYNSCRASVIR